MYLACTLSFALASAAVSTIPLRTQPVPRAPVTLESVFSSVRVIRSQPVILGALSLDLFAVRFGGATAPLPIFARGVLHAGPIGHDLLCSASPVGALGGTIWLAYFPLRKRPGAAMFGGVLAFGIATLIFGLSHSFIVSLFALMALGASDVISVVVRLSLVQLRTPHEMLGRVSAVDSLFIGTSNQPGEFESGVTAGWWSAQTIAIALLRMRLFPELRRTRTLEREEHGATEAQRNAALTNDQAR